VTDTATEETTTAQDEGPSLEFRTQRFVLHTLLDKASKVVPSGDMMPVLKNFHLEASDGRLAVMATDLELSILVEAQLVEASTAGAVMLPARKLLEIVNAAAEDELRMTVVGSDCHIECGSAKWDLKLSATPDQYPPLPERDVEFDDVDRHFFLEALNGVKGAVGKVTARPDLQVLDIRGGKITASDGQRAQQVIMQDEQGEFWWPEDLPCQIPSGAVPELIRLLKSTEAEEIGVTTTTDHLIFRIGQDVFTMAALELDYPDIEALLISRAIGNELDLTVDREELEHAIARVRVTSDTESAAMLITLEENSMSVTTRDKMQNKASEYLNVRWEHPRLEVAVSHIALAEMLSMTDSPSCVFLFDASDTKTRRSPVLFKNERQLGIISQMRAEWTAD